MGRPGWVQPERAWDRREDRREVCHRASALPRDQRRAAIAAATLPLLLAHGWEVTSRQIAQAAGVAEGTLFRVFEDKEAIVRAAVDLAFDPEPIDKALCALDQSLPFRERLVCAVGVVRRHMADIGRLVMSVGAPTVFARGPRVLPELRRLTALFAANDQNIRIEPAEAARRFCALIVATSHPALVGHRPLPATEVVSMFLDGVANRDLSSRGLSGGGRRC